MKGKIKCEYLKQLRKEIADKNGINYEISKCEYQGECKGTCPRCDAELKQLTEQVKAKKLAKGLAGVTLGVAAVTLAGCAPDVGDIQGDMAYIPSIEESSENTEVAPTPGVLEYDSEYDSENNCNPEETCEIEEVTEEDSGLELAGDIMYIPDEMDEVVEDKTIEKTDIDTNK